MNADYPANPATTGAHPFPGVTQAVPQGPGGPEAASPQWGAVGPRMQSEPGAGGGPVRPGAPAVPPPSPYAAPGGSTGTANPTPPSQPAAPAMNPLAQHAPTQHTTTQHTAAQPAPAQRTSTQQPATPTAPGTPHAAPSNPLAPTVAAPIRRTSLRTGTQPVETNTETPAPKKFSLFGKKAEAEVPATGTTTTTLRRKGGPRKVRAMLISVDPWSAMKMSFLTSIAAGIALVVAVSVVWGVLNTMGVFTAIQVQITTLFNLSTETSILQYFQYSKVMSGAILIAVFNAVILTALGTISALIYNIIGKLVGGVYVTLSDD
jgi:hypothetical protein